jgi:hypothetical protein
MVSYYQVFRPLSGLLPGAERFYTATRITRRTSHYTGSGLEAAGSARVLRLTAFGFAAELYKSFTRRTSHYTGSGLEAAGSARVLQLTAFGFAAELYKSFTRRTSHYTGSRLEAVQFI